MISVDRSASDVAILIPAYGGAEKLRACLASLGKYAPWECRIFVLDDGTPDESIRDCCRKATLDRLTYVRSEENRGFVGTCNWGWSKVAPPNSDILLLNSDTEVTGGFLEEMFRVLYLDERHAVVTPRSNSATIYSLPNRPGSISPAESFRIWEEMRDQLPDFRVMPTAVGFCMLIKAIILERFGFFDEIYSPGYNEENDFICRINRYGFSAVAANHAFVYHHENSSFGAKRAALERAHRKILSSRYPEYDRKVANYFEFELDPVEKFASLRSAHRPSLLFDLFHLPAQHSGTSEFALNLLRELHTLMEDEWDLFVGVSAEARFFFNELNGYRLFEDRPGSDRLFDIVFKPNQIFTWGEFMRMNRLAPRLSFVVQDIISVRCDYLTSSDRKVIFSRTLETADQVYAISDCSQSDVDVFFPKSVPAVVIHHGTNAGISPAEAMPGEYVLLVGNNYAHKGLKEAIVHLTEVGPVRVLGGEAPAEELPPHIDWLKSGHLSRSFVRELYAKASILVYPSYYEGYGLPIIEALGLGKPVVVLDNQLNRELARSLQNDGLHLVRSVRELKEVVLSALQNTPNGHFTSKPKTRRWRNVAKDYLAGFEELLERRPDAGKLHARNKIVQVLNAARHP